MPLRERLRHSAPALALLILNLFLGLSLWGYDPADAERWRSAVGDGQPVALTNPCGPVGARLADGAQQLVGWAAWLLPAGLAAVNILIARGRRPSDRFGPVVGFALVLAVAAALVDKFGSGLRPSPPVGPGGYVGALAATALETNFGLAGMLLILLTAGLVGFALGQELLVSLPLRELSAFTRPLLPRRRGEGRAMVPAHASHEGYAGGDWRTAQALGDQAPPRPALERSAVITEVANRPGPVFQRGGTPSQSARSSGQSSAVARQAPAAYPAVDPASPFQLPPLELLEPTSPFPVQEHEAQVHARAMLLERTLLDFGYQVRVVQIDTGPVITQYEIELEAGLRVSRIAGLADDLAIAMAVPTVRIVAPIPGKTTVGIELPNEHREIVRLGDVIGSVDDESRKCKIPLFLGKDAKGAPMAFDMADMPHLLIAGRTGTGKSVCLNAMIMSILMSRRPDEVKMIMIDPKIVELTQFKKIPHLMHPVITDMRKVEPILSWACDKMDERYEWLARAGVRNIASYNALGPDEVMARVRPEDEEEAKRVPTHMPYIVIVADEIADMMMTVGTKEAEQHIVRLAQKSRAVGMHLILATQRPTVDVVTGLIKGNMPARIAFQVASRSDSRIVLDESGADKLLGNGDMLFLVPGTSQLVRAQGTYVSDAELNRVTEYLSQYPAEYSREMMQLKAGSGPSGKERGAALKERDELYEPAVEIVVREGRGSSSLLQRALGIGYGRASRLIDFMFEDGIVGEFKSGAAREVLYTWEEWEALKGGGEVPGDGDNGQGADPGEAAA